MCSRCPPGVPEDGHESLGLGLDGGVQDAVSLEVPGLEHGGAGLALRVPGRAVHLRWEHRSDRFNEYSSSYLWDSISMTSHFW